MFAMFCRVEEEEKRCVVNVGLRVEGRGMRNEG